MRRRKEYNQILMILDILIMGGNEVVQISNDRDSYTLGASKYSFKVTELL